MYIGLRLTDQEVYKVRTLSYCSSKHTWNLSNRDGREASRDQREIDGERYGNRSRKTNLRAGRRRRSVEYSLAGLPAEKDSSVDTSDLKKWEDEICGWLDL